MLDRLSAPATTEDGRSYWKFCIAIANTSPDLICFLSRALPRCTLSNLILGQLMFTGPCDYSCTALRNISAPTRCTLPTRLALVPFRLMLKPWTLMATGCGLSTTWAFRQGC